MKVRLKSSTFCSFFAFLGFLLLAGCAATHWPVWLTGEPGEDVLSAPRVVGSPPSLGDTSWPNLATVPEKPKNFSAAQDRKPVIQEMLEDKQDAEEAKERLDNMLVEEPFP
jgi:hypothetical protein